MICWDAALSIYKYLCITSSLFLLHKQDQIKSWNFLRMREINNNNNNRKTDILIPIVFRYPFIISLNQSSDLCQTVAKYTGWSESTFKFDSDVCYFSHSPGRLNETEVSAGLQQSHHHHISEQLLRRRAALYLPTRRGFADPGGIFVALHQESGVGGPQHTQQGCTLTQHQQRAHRHPLVCQKWIHTKRHLWNHLDRAQICSLFFSNVRMLQMWRLVMARFYRKDVFFLIFMVLW